LMKPAVVQSWSLHLLESHTRQNLSLVVDEVVAQFVNRLSPSGNINMKRDQPHN